MPDFDREALLVDLPELGEIARRMIVWVDPFRSSRELKRRRQINVPGNRHMLILAIAVAMGIDVFALLDGIGNGPHHLGDRGQEPIDRLFRHVGNRLAQLIACRLSREDWRLALLYGRWRREMFGLLEPGGDICPYEWIDHRHFLVGLGIEHHDLLQVTNNRGIPAPTELPLPVREFVEVDDIPVLLMHRHGALHKKISRQPLHEILSERKRLRSSFLGHQFDRVAVVRQGANRAPCNPACELDTDRLLIDGGQENLHILLADPLQHDLERAHHVR